MSLYNSTGWIIFILMLYNISNAVVGLGCFVCNSNYTTDNTPCADDFNTTTTTDTSASNDSAVSYQDPCMAYRQGRSGLFPADHCIKIKGYRKRNDGTSEYVYIRTCGLDSGSTTSDTEIVRQSHCGTLNLKLGLSTHTYSGCVQTCDTDGCNKSPHLRANYLLILIVILATLVELSRR